MVHVIVIEGDDLGMTSYMQDEVKMKIQKLFRDCTGDQPAVHVMANMGLNPVVNGQPVVEELKFRKI